MNIKKFPADRVWVDQNDGVAVVLKEKPLHQYLSTYTEILTQYQ